MQLSLPTLLLLTVIFCQIKTCHTRVVVLPLPATIEQRDPEVLENNMMEMAEPQKPFPIFAEVLENNMFEVI